jgi:glycosyltransferase involved in cell wall biosynthesis
MHCRLKNKKNTLFIDMEKEDKRKIIFISYCFEYGGAQRLLSTLLKYLDKKKFTFFVICCKKKGGMLKRIQDDANIFDLRTYTLATIFEFFIAALKIAKIIKKERIQLVVAADCNWTSLVTSFSKFIFRWNPALVLEENVVLSRFYTFDNSKFVFLKKLLTRLLYPKSNLIIVPSAGVRNDLCENFNIHPSHIKVIPNPVDIEAISRLSKEAVSHPWFLNKEVPVAVIACRLVKSKNLDWLIDICVDLHKQQMLRLLILGEGPEQERLEALIKRFNADEYIQLLEPQENPFKFVSKSDIFILPSLTESFSYILVEAMACGVPVISVNCPSGPREIIDDGMNGFLVEPYDKEGMKSKILLLLRDANLRKKFLNNSMMSLYDFELKKILKKYVKIFEISTQITHK